MKFKLYKNFGALNSVPVFTAFAAGVIACGHEIVEDGEDVAVIWSVLWNGRMAGNQQIYNACVKQNKPIVVIEVGNLKRGQTWRISEAHINGLGIFGNIENLDTLRPQQLGVGLHPEKTKRRSEILIATQHSRSLQWQGQPSMEQWIRDTIVKIKRHSGRRIVVRPHPRSPISLNMPGVEIGLPRQIVGSYDDFDIDYNCHCVVNHNSGPAVQAAIHGTPIICDSSSLAGEISGKFEDIETAELPDREDWFLKLCHTEWTVSEITKGIPMERLIPLIYQK
jgi:hypothetical protein